MLAVGGRPLSLRTQASPQAAWVSSGRAGDSPRVGTLREGEPGRAYPFYDFTSRYAASVPSVSPVLWIRNEPPSLTDVHGEGVRHCLLKEGLSTFADIFYLFIFYFAMLNYIYLEQNIISYIKKDNFIKTKFQSQLCMIFG